MAIDCMVLVLGWPDAQSIQLRTIALEMAPRGPAHYVPAGQAIIPDADDLKEH